MQAYSRLWYQILLTSGKTVGCVVEPWDSSVIMFKGLMVSALNQIHSYEMSTTFSDTHCTVSTSIQHFSLSDYHVLC